jgi:hypothetical protein
MGHFLNLQGKGKKTKFSDTNSVTLIEPNEATTPPKRAKKNKKEVPEY